MRANKIKECRRGFTIVELLVVIVVIGILAAITIVSYTGITQRATVASLQSDLDNSSKQLKMFQVENSNYPATINCAILDSSINKCIKSSTGNSYQYGVNNSASPQSFSLTAINGTQNYNINQNGVIVAGGRNLLADSNFQTSANNTGLGDAASMSNENIPYWRVTAATNISTYEGPIYSLAMTVGNVYTVSCEVRIPTTGNVAFYNGIGYNNGIPANTWTKIYYTFTYSVNYRIGGNTYAGTQLDYRRWKVEPGGIATDWTPGP